MPAQPRSGEPVDEIFAPYRPATASGAGRSDAGSHAYPHATWPGPTFFTFLIRYGRDDEVDAGVSR